MGTNYTRPRSFTFFSDPGHGWLKVRRNDLKRLNLEHKISYCSYERKGYVYLEEDGDASLFIESMRAAHWQFTIQKTQYTNKQSKIRGYSSYYPKQLEGTK